MSHAKVEKVGWRIDQWCAATAISRSRLYELLKANKLASVRVGKSRIILDSPIDFLRRAATTGGDD
jgi:hypothetical protein